MYFVTVLHEIIDTKRVCSMLQEPSLQPVQGNQSSYNLAKIPKTLRRYINIKYDVMTSKIQLPTVR